MVGGLPGGIFWGWVNATLYGGVLRTGYGDVSWYFGWRFAGPNALHFAKWLPVLLSPPVVLAALGLPWVPSAPAPIRLLLATWFGAFAGFYVFYSFSGMEWWYLRFLLPAFPAVILAGALVARVLLAKIESGRTRGAVGAALLAVMTIWNVRVGDAHNVSHIARSDEAYKLTADWLQEELPGNAIVLVSQLSGAMTYYTDFALIRWDTIEDEATWAKVRGAAAAAKRPLYAALYDFEIERAFTSEYVPGKWERVAQIRQMSVWRLHD